MSEQALIDNGSPGALEELRIRLEAEKEDRVNPNHDKAGKFAPKKGVAVGTGSSATVNIGGKQYKQGDNITVNGKPHHIAEITGDKVIVRPGAAPAKSSVPPKAKATTTTVTMGTKTPTDGTVIETPAQANAYAARQKLPAPTGHARTAYKDYSEREFSVVNDALRDGRDPGQTEFDMQKHMRRSVLKEPVVVSRVVGSDAFNGNPGSFVGKTIKDEAYLSTSLLKGGPKAGKTWWDSKDVVMHIHVPAGTRAVHMEPLTKVKGEHELLIDKGSNIRINEAKKVGGKWLVKAEILP